MLQAKTTHMLLREAEPVRKPLRHNVMLSIPFGCVVSLISHERIVLSKLHQHSLQGSEIAVVPESLGYPSRRQKDGTDHHQASAGRNDRSGRKLDRHDQTAVFRHITRMYRQRHRSTF